MFSYMHMYLCLLLCISACYYVSLHTCTCVICTCVRGLCARASSHACKCRCIVMSMQACTAWMHVYTHTSPCFYAQTRTYSCMHIYVQIPTCMHMNMCAHIWECARWSVDGTIDSRNNLLSFQAMRPSAHQISTSNVPTTHWVRAAFSPCLSAPLLFISLSTFLLTALAPPLPVSSWDFSRGLSLIPFLQRSEDLCRCGTWVSGSSGMGGCREPELSVRGGASHLGPANELASLGRGNDFFLGVRKGALLAISVGKATPSVHRSRLIHTSFIHSFIHSTDVYSLRWCQR